MEDKFSTSNLRIAFLRDAPATPYDLSPGDVAVGRVLDPTLAAKAVLWAGGRVFNLNGPATAGRSR